MSVAEAEPAAREEAGGRAADGLPAASVPESVRILVAGVLPSVVRGLFSPRRRAMRWLTALNTDRRAVRTLSGIRDRHPGQGVRLLGGRIVVLWGPDALREVLDRSADLYASDAGAKAKGMSHFQPDALTLSRGEEWRDRRAFNEHVLATSERVHPFGDRFLTVVADEVGRLRLDGELAWPDFERLFDHVTLRVIFGDGAREDHELTDLLEELMAEANRLVGLKESDEYHEFYGRLERRLREPEPGSLIARFAEAPQTDTTRVVQQIPHWMFAMRDTLGANAYRALAVVVADPAVEGRVRDELAGADLGDPAAVAGVGYLEGCLVEAMRLWPTTPLLAREVTRDTELAGEQLEEGTQVMILNGFNHRDPEAVADADRLRPERWSDEARDYRFNHLSNGSQDCPGGPMVLFLGKAVLARMLERFRLRLAEPELETGEPLPHMLDFFRIRFDAEEAR
ncbi:MAG TPA: cytochrome P450 [Thermoleophilaceae bacterium]|nr:cytochrome P450 [Thermoleophilaceae bacterium]